MIIKLTHSCADQYCQYFPLPSYFPSIFCFPSQILQPQTLTADPNSYFPSKLYLSPFQYLGDLCPLISPDTPINSLHNAHTGKIHYHFFYIQVNPLQAHTFEFTVTYTLYSCRYPDNHSLYSVHPLLHSCFLSKNSSLNCHLRPIPPTFLFLPLGITFSNQQPLQCTAQYS